MGELKIEAGKYYKLRNGKKAFCRCVALPDPFSNSISDFCVTISYAGCATAHRRLDGRGCTSSLDDADIVSEWCEPHVEQVVLRTILNTLHPNNRPFLVVGTDPYPNHYEVLAMRRVTVKEGEFDD